MAVFGSPFSGLTNDRKLTDAELVRSIRFMANTEYEATQLYMQLAGSNNKKLVGEVLKTIADKELENVGEFLKLLREIAPDDENIYIEGAEEVEKLISKAK